MRVCVQGMCGCSGHVHPPPNDRTPPTHTRTRRQEKLREAAQAELAAKAIEAKAMVRAA